MKKTRLILIEGLPGSGKSTIAKMVYEILNNMKVDTQLFLEGNLDHPADYDGVAFYTKEEYNKLLINNHEYKDIINKIVVIEENGYFVPYKKMFKEYGSKLPDDLFYTLYNNDIYELPLEKNIELITNRWRNFADNIIECSEIYVFECCFIQNPVTVGMIKYNCSKKIVIDYISKLAVTIKKLNPLLIYINQDDTELSFKKVINERHKGWSEGFIDYYTNQGYGKENKLKGLDGTLEVLKARKEFEMEIYDLLDMDKIIFNNSEYDLEKSKDKLIEKLKNIYRFRPNKFDKR